MIKLSIITVTYNSEKYIEEAIKSVINQTYENVEYIIVDGNSQDNTLNIIKKYRDSIYKIISEPDKNMYEAINKGMAVSTGDYIAILNSDDFYLNNRVLEKVASKLEKLDKKYEGIYTNLYKYSQDGSFIKKRKGFQVGYNVLLCSKKLTFVGHGTLFISRKAYEVTGNYNFEKFCAAADYDYVLKLFRKFRFKYVNLDVMGFRMHPNSITSSGKITSEVGLVLKENGYMKVNILKRIFLYQYGWIKFILLNIKHIL